MDDRPERLERAQMYQSVRPDLPWDKVLAITSAKLG
jgi:hypothetical protein